jgi:adenylate kinase family enzyme
MAQSTDSIETNLKAILGGLVILGFPKKIAMMKIIRDELAKESQELVEKNQKLFVEIEKKRVLKRKENREDVNEMENLLGTLNEIGI